LPFLKKISPENYWNMIETLPFGYVGGTLEEKKGKRMKGSESERQRH
jgi:hypothetical protein